MPSVAPWLRFGGAFCPAREGPHYTARMLKKSTRPLRLAARATLILATVLAFPAAWAQWGWVDNSGRKVFSDTAPPASVPEKNIIKRPGNGSFPSVPAAPAVTPAVAAATSPAAPAALQVPDKDPELEARKKQAEAAEEAKRKAEAERVARARADNCERARKNKGMLESGVRIATTNAKGEREFMDDKARLAEVQRTEQTIRSDCGPLPQ
jgi:hypothetical protein